MKPKTDRTGVFHDKTKNTSLLRHLEALKRQEVLTHKPQAVEERAEGGWEGDVQVPRTRHDDLKRDPNHL
jgi:hypothetical protein